MRASSALLLAAALSGCSSDSSLSLTLVLLTGQEPDAFTRAPKPDRLEIRTISAAGTSTIASMAWPTGEFDIADVGTDSYAAFEAVGRNTAGDAVLLGRTLPMQLGSLNGAQVPLFMGRVGELARPPESLPHTCTDGIAEIVDDELLVLAGGTEAVDASGAGLSSASASGYDLVVWGSLSVVTLPRAPASMAVVSLRYGLLIDATGATWVDFDSTWTEEAAAPSGLSFASIAGGRTVYGASGEAYVVGGTRRMGEPTAVVLRVGTDRSLTALSLSTARLGAAASWVTDRGLVVAGGSGQAPGAELLASGASQFATLPFPADATAGAGATALDSSKMLLVGGEQDQGIRVLDLSCTGSCAAKSLPGASRAGVLNASAWALASNKALVMGTAPDGETDGGQVRVTFLTLGEQDAQAVDVALREPRRGAAAVVLPTGMIALAGGRLLDGKPARSIEVFVPPP